MTLQELYEDMEGNYPEVIKRFTKEERIIKYLKKFQTQPTIRLIREALEGADYELAFREVHNLKGVCASLGMTKLRAVAEILTEALRGGEPKGDVMQMFFDVQREYDKVMISLVKGF